MVAKAGGCNTKVIQMKVILSSNYLIVYFRLQNLSNTQFLVDLELFDVTNCVRTDLMQLTL